MYNSRAISSDHVNMVSWFSMIRLFKYMNDLNLTLYETYLNYDKGVISSDTKRARIVAMTKFNNNFLLTIILTAFTFNKTVKLDILMNCEIL